MDAHILIVEDDKNLSEYLTTFLNDKGYITKAVYDGVEALKSVEKVEPDLVLLDLELPVLKGDSVCLDLKKNYPHLPIIILTARDSTSQIVQGLNLGADDYITKPFESEELIARIKARIRDKSIDGKLLQVGDLKLNSSSMDVTRGDDAIQLTPQEYKLLEYLMLHPGRVLTREMILSRLWQGSPDIETRVVDVYVGYLRKKIDQGQKIKLIQSVRGFGYKLAAS